MTIQDLLLNPDLKALRHTFRIIRFIYTKLRFEKTFLRSTAHSRTKYKKIEELLKEEFKLDSYPDIYSMLFNEGKRLAYLNIVIPMLMSLYHKRLKETTGKSKS